MKQLNKIIPESIENECRNRISKGSKSFSLAAQILPASIRSGAFVIYAWCRRADDAIDKSELAFQGKALEKLSTELDTIFVQKKTTNTIVNAFGDVAFETKIPSIYPREMLEGMRMDINQPVYTDTEMLLLYCYRVASTVGLMMSHVIGLNNLSALHSAAQLGIAMQLTNICRDVLEDWNMNRLYLPQDLLAQFGIANLKDSLGKPFPASYIQPMKRVIQQLLKISNTYYKVSNNGLLALPWQASISIRAAGRIYSSIGKKIKSNDYDITSGRAVVPLSQKILCLLFSLYDGFSEIPNRLSNNADYNIPTKILTFNELNLL